MIISTHLNIFVKKYRGFSHDIFD